MVRSGQDSPLAALPVRRMILSGSSASAAVLVNYLPAHRVYRLSNMQPIYDGFLVRWADEGTVPPRADRILVDRDTSNDGSPMALDQFGNPRGGIDASRLRQVYGSPDGYRNRVEQLARGPDAARLVAPGVSRPDPGRRRSGSLLTERCKAARLEARPRTMARITGHEPGPREETRGPVGRADVREHRVRLPGVTHAG